jgi:isocitrate dehydrogenase (NAD+)
MRARRELGDNNRKERMSNRTIVVLEGDQTGQELLLEGLRVLDPSVTRVGVDFLNFDLSLPNRERTKNGVVHDAAAAMKEHGLGIKAATITSDVKGGTGSPNAILRQEIDGTVIVRTGRRLPGVLPVGGVSAPIAVVRMAVDDAYTAKEWREGEGYNEVAYRTENINRGTCRMVCEFAFRQARKMNARVFGGPKYTVSPIYEGMFKEEMDAAAKRYPEVRYEPQLIDATYALVMGRASEPLVIPALNRDGDCLSDLVLAFYGSIAGSESILISFDENFDPRVVMTEAPHGTAPALEGKNLANPLAMILAGASLLTFIGTPEASRASRAIYEGAFEAINDGIRTLDLGGHTTTTEFTDDVIRRVRTKFDVWQALGDL